MASHILQSIDIKADEDEEMYLHEIRSSNLSEEALIAGIQLEYESKEAKIKNLFRMRKSQLIEILLRVREHVDRLEKQRNQLLYPSNDASKPEFPAQQPNSLGWNLFNSYNLSKNSNIGNIRLSYIEKLRRVFEGLAEEELSPMSDDKKNSDMELAPIFEGVLDRNAMALALEAVLSHQSLSQRKAAEIAGVSRSAITQIKSQDASLDQAAKVFADLGYEVEFSLKPIDKS